MHIVCLRPVSSVRFGVIFHPSASASGRIGSAGAGTAAGFQPICRFSDLFFRSGACPYGLHRAIRYPHRKATLRFCQQRSLAGHLDRGRRILGRVRQPADRSGAALQGAAGQARQHPGAARRLAPSEQRQAGGYGGLSGFPARHRVSGGRTGLGGRKHLQCRSGNRHPGRPAARGPGDQRPLCAERGQCALGQPVRRAVRHRRHL
ncbi:hypothetical protein GALL_548450 [mine drainage metagenome]|uniref:Uncharacterized protein n=1 Tax=mine drainage metagenome TaxID=410659 RepID=A0A1J5NXV3_9ZZZZ